MLPDSSVYFYAYLCFIVPCLVSWAVAMRLLKISFFKEKTRL